MKNIKHGFQEVLKDPGWSVPQVSETLGERVDYVQSECDVSVSKLLSFETFPFF